MTADRPHVVFLCTGNAARSVMAALMLRDRDDRFVVTGAGTVDSGAAPDEEVHEAANATTTTTPASGRRLGPRRVLRMRIGGTSICACRGRANVVPIG